MELTLLRHAPTPGNLLRRYIGVTDEPLSPQGREMALKLNIAAPGRLYISPLLRCRQTAELCFPGVPAVVVPELRETDFGLFEGRSYEELKNETEYIKWLDSGGAIAFPGGEAPQDARRRALSALDFILSDCERDGINSAAAVTHGGTIMAIMAARTLPRRDYYDWQLKNCGYFTVQVNNGALLYNEIKE